MQVVRWLGVVLLALAALPAIGAAQALTGLTPAEPQPAAPQLAPGLAVRYTYGIMNHVDELARDRKFEDGPPLPHLNWKVGSGNVLTSKASDGVGAIVTGFIRFEKSGTYGFDVTSNDGVRIEIGGKLLYEDPGVHADDTSERIEVKIDRPGWYLIRIAYFEKRNTSTLILRWSAPGETAKLSPVPAGALAHGKK